MKDQLDNLGFGESLKFTFGLNASSYGSEGFTSDIQLADSGYGQGENDGKPGTYGSNLHSIF